MNIKVSLLSLNYYISVFKEGIQLVTAFKFKVYEQVETFLQLDIVPFAVDKKYKGKSTSNKTLTPLIPSKKVS